MKEARGNIILRQAVDTDVEAIVGCINKAYGHYQERLGRPPGPMTQNYAEVIGNNDVYVAMVNHRVEGVLVLTETSEGFLLDNIAVNPAIQGSGVGRVLLEFAEQQAWSAGYKSIYLYTHEKMWENQALYQRIGYEEYDRRTEQGLERVYMRKTLKV